MFELIISILNRGYSDLVMEAAKEAGARGGTIIHAKGTGTHNEEKFFGITIQPEKEMVWILAPRELRNEIMTAIANASGLKTPGCGITFSMSVDNVLGISSYEEVACSNNKEENK